MVKHRLWVVRRRVRIPVHSSCSFVSRPLPVKIGTFVFNKTASPAPLCVFFVCFFRGGGNTSLVTIAYMSSCRRCRIVSTARCAHGRNASSTGVLPTAGASSTPFTSQQYQPLVSYSFSVADTKAKTERVKERKKEKKKEKTRSRAHKME